MTEIEIRGQFNGYAAYILDVLDKSLDPDMTVSRGLISFDCWYSQNSGSKPIEALVDYEIPHEYIKEWYLKHVKPLIKNGSLLENGEALPATLFGIVAKHNALPKIKPDEEEEEAISTCNSCGGRMKKKLESSGQCGVCKLRKGKTVKKEEEPSTDSQCGVCGHRYKKTSDETNGSCDVCHKRKRMPKLEPISRKEKDDDHLSAISKARAHSERRLMEKKLSTEAEGVFGALGKWNEKRKLNNKIKEIQKLQAELEKKMQTTLLEKKRAAKGSTRAIQLDKQYRDYEEKHKDNEDVLHELKLKQLSADASGKHDRNNSNDEEETEDMILDRVSDLACYDPEFKAMVTNTKVNPDVLDLVKDDVFTARDILNDVENSAEKWSTTDPAKKGVITALYRLSIA